MLIVALTATTLHAQDTPTKADKKKEKKAKTEKKSKAKKRDEEA